MKKVPRSISAAVRLPLLALSVSVLLASCSQGSQEVAIPQAAAPEATAQTFESRQAYIQGLTAPAEPVATTPVTDLSTTLPGGRKLSAQAIDKSVPIILVHGLTGFGRTELGGVIKYWGGSFDIQEDLKAQGYKVFTAAVGPFSSDWARASELYAQIKGGCVDYGAARAAQFGHSRFDAAKCYPGFYPQWDAQHPVNLIGHSMGGTTARLLVKLLDDGSPTNANGNNLFRGGRTGWVKNVMTISAPNSGSPAADTLQIMIPQLQQLVLDLSAAATSLGLDPLYDFKLGQYGLKRLPGETFKTYVARVMNSPVMTSKDTAAWDLRPDGAAAQNAFIGRSKVTKYFSWANLASNRGLLTGWHYPDPTMNPVLLPTSYPAPWPLLPGLGNMTGSSAFGAVRYDSSWWSNDGLVPSNYMDAPLGQTSERYAGQTTQLGRWYALGTVEGYDHIDMVGLLTLRDVRVFYRNQAAFLNSQ